MCGRYQLGFNKEELAAYESILKDIQETLTPSPMLTVEREVFPSQRVPLFTHEIAEDLGWGYKLSKKLLINARTDSIMSKAFYKDTFAKGRCIIPAKAYYEWDSHKNKFSFKPERGLLFMAGLLLEQDGEQHCLIITTEANKDVSKVHHRMPVIIDERNLLGYLKGSSEQAFSLLQPYDQSMIIKEASHRQLSIMDL